MITGLPEQVLRRIREFLQRKTPGQIVLDVDGGGRVVHVQLTEHIRLTSRENFGGTENPSVPVREAQRSDQGRIKSV
jgi:hypothetical protein